MSYEKNPLCKIDRTTWELVPKAGWKALDNVYRAQSMIKPLGSMTGHIIRFYGFDLNLDSNLEVQARPFMEASHPPLRDFEKELFMEGMYEASQEKNQALQGWIDEHDQYVEPQLRLRGVTV